MLQFDVCCKDIDQNFDCGCDRCAILRLDSLITISLIRSSSVSRSTSELQGHCTLVYCCLVGTCHCMWSSFEVTSSEYPYYAS